MSEITPKKFEITIDETRQLVKLLETEYISNEFYGLVKIMLKRANNFLDNQDELS